MHNSPAAAAALLLLWAGCLSGTATALVGGPPRTAASRLSTRRMRGPVRFAADPPSPRSWLARHPAPFLSQSQSPSPPRLRLPASSSGARPSTRLRASSSTAASPPSPKGAKRRRRKTLWEALASSVSQRAALKSGGPESYKCDDAAGDKARVQIQTLLRVILPSLAVGAASIFAFPALALFLASTFNDAGVFAVLSTDSSQFVQNFLSVSSLLFSILVGQTYYFMYQQQEAVYYALFNEVTEAKSLLEQVALVCQGRSMYQRCLTSIRRYVEQDLKKLRSDPAVLLSARPVDDPLESIMYMTSVGVPSTVYETVRSLRQARAGRLGALQRKLPQVHMLLLWVLAGIELVSFPLLGAGTQSIGGYNILTVEGILFGVMTTGIVLTLRVVGELWRPAGGAYNVDAVLSVMVRGLEEELEARMSGGKVYASSLQAPSPARETDGGEIPEDKASSPAPAKEALPVQLQGADVGAAAGQLYRWIRRRRGSRDAENRSKEK